MANPGSISCSFCGKDRAAVTRMVAGPNVYICDECIQACAQILESDALSIDFRSRIPPMIAHLNLRAEVDRLAPDATIGDLLHALSAPVARAAALRAESARLDDSRADLNGQMRALQTRLDDVEQQRSRLLRAADAVATGVTPDPS